MSSSLTSSFIACEKAIVECLYRFAQPMTERWIYDNLCCLYSKRLVHSALQSLYRLNCLGVSNDKDWYLLNLNSVFVKHVISELCA